MIYNTESYSLIASMLKRVFVGKKYLTIFFPIEEHEELRKKLNKREEIKTTRDKDEVTKFHAGKKYLTNIPITYKNPSYYVVEISRIQDYKNNYRYAEITMIFAGTKQP